MAGENWEIWLSLTNIALGLIVLFALLLVVGTVGWDLYTRWAHWSRAMKSVDGELNAMFHEGSEGQSFPDLGLTMQDGGERIEPPNEGPQRKNRDTR
jgi:hypothetical protein